jgi:hypothetical protein
VNFVEKLTIPPMPWWPLQCYGTVEECIEQMRTTRIVMTIVFSAFLGAATVLLIIEIRLYCLIIREGMRDFIDMGRILTERNRTRESNGGEADPE